MEGTDGDGEMKREVQVAAGRSSRTAQNTAVVLRRSSWSVCCLVEVIDAKAVLMLCFHA